MFDNLASAGSLSAMVRRADGLYEHHGLVGDLAKFSDDGASSASQAWRTALHALHLDARGADLLHRLADTLGVAPADVPHAHIPEEFVKGRHHLGSGTITNVGVTAHSNDPFALAAIAPFLKYANYHGLGTGTTASAATDYQLQTPGNPTTVTAITGTQTNPSTAMTSAQYRTASTANFTAPVAVTEWALLNAATLTAATGSPATATSATTLTATGTPFTTNQFAGYIVVAGSVYGIVASNTTSVLTLLGGWCNTSNGLAGATPGATSAYTLQPICWDHKVFAQINVASGDSLVTTYTCTEASGG